MLVHIASNNSTSNLEGGWNNDSIQPNAIDLRLERVFVLHPTEFIIDEETKVHRRKTEQNTDDKGYFHFLPGSYEISFEGIVSIGHDEAGVVITRSTLNRNGIFITSGLYDSGYVGSMAACLHVNGGEAWIKKGTRIGQFITLKSEAVSSYDGDYGLSKQMDAHLRN